MPRLIDDPGGPTLALDETVEAIHAARVDFRDEDGFATLAPVLAGLGRNRRFLGDLVIAELEARCANQVRDNRYGPQVVLLHAGRQGWFIRANIWPAADDSIVAANGEAAFFYDVPHDHNFSFLTHGYFGPGYESDYWTYDHDAVAGAIGEPVALVPAGRHRLDPGRMMLYRAHRDVHRQLPPESLSVTLNIVESGPRQRWLDQYRFDVDAGTVTGIANPLATATLLPLAARLGGEAAADVLAEVARRHPSDRLRFAAISALAGTARDIDGRIDVFAKAGASSSTHVRVMSRRAIARLEAGRAWITGDRSGSEPIAHRDDGIAA